MATAGTGGGSADDSTVHKLTCAICLEKYRLPKLLPCFHSFCQSCLQGVAGSNPSFSCPACRRVVLLPPGGVAALQNRDDGQNSNEQHVIPSLGQEVTPHKSKKAYKPLFWKDTTLGGEDKDTQALLRRFTSVLNELTPKKYEELSADVLTLSINTEERLTGITNLLFEKAISEVKFSALYACLCRDMLKLPKVVRADKTKLTFRAVLLTMCQKEFEKNIPVEGYSDKKRRELEGASVDKKTSAELEESATKDHKRSIGNIRFIGELFRLKLLTENIMHDCMFELLKLQDNESIECACNLLETIGQDLDTPKGKVRMDRYFQQFEKMTADVKREEELDITTGESVKDAQANQSPKKDFSEPILCSRVKSYILNIIDLRKNNWVKTRIKTENNPTTLDKIHQKAKPHQELRMIDPNPSLGGTRGKGHCSMQGDSEGGNMVPAKPVRQQIDVTKMKVRKTNFNIEEDAHAAIATPQPRLCDVCTEDKEATHKCTQCQKRYCSPCHRVHDSVSACCGHTVVSLGQGEEAGCGDLSESGKSKKEEMCPKHPDQHEGHPTQDLVDVQAKVKANLQGTLGRVERKMQQIDQAVLAAEDRCSKLQQQQKKTEQKLKHHADTLHQWVDQAQDEAVASVQSVTEGMVTALQGRIQQLRNTHTTLQAQRDHTIQVLKDGKNDDMVSLEFQLNASDFEGADLKKIEKELNTEIPAINIKRNNTAVSPLQLRSFVGVLQPVQQSDASMTQQTIAAEGDDVTQVGDRPASTTTMHDVSITPGSVVAGGGGDTQSTDRSASAATLSDVSITEKRPPRRIVYSRNPQSTVLSICPISKDRLWICYKPGKDSVTMMKLFDIQGQELKKIDKSDVYKLFTVNEDVLVYHLFSKQLDWIKPDGTVTTHTLEFGISDIAACAEDGQLYLREMGKDELYQVQITVTDKLHCSKQNLVLKEQPDWSCLRDVSSAGQYFAFIRDGTAKVYGRTENHDSVLHATYKPTKQLVSAQFCKISGQEVLLVLTEDKVHVVDHTDGDHFLHYLDTGDLKLDSARCLSTDYHRHVWIGCKGGTVVQVDL